MDIDNKNIDLSNRSKELDDNIEDDGYEDWEDDYELISKGDYEGLKKLRQMIAKNNPEDIDAQWRLGEAYILCKEHEKAIDFFEPLYRANPDFEDIEYSILDALFALGKSERDFKWVTVPVILRLDKKTSDFCYDYLKGKRKARELDDVFCQLLVEGYLTFDEEELLNHLTKDGRFEFQIDTPIQSSLVSVKKRKINR
ncbi:hypothetical protein DEAC_c36890 [Desulfosporosinus acididurans]|uniref:Uncharacterized protein n=1 Tax=Desulfosporosinus acididurans TaxID=476652 RepID=A0A0J1FM97_9FIRM|nr:tetratricopeptide repeat protein [Desulfosporosinus acididurans]KLU64487.1 hypothetical protein DEAC_c36890 [Desulfosporosinus acididurans]